MITLDITADGYPRTKLTLWPLGNISSLMQYVVLYNPIGDEGNEIEIGRVTQLPAPQGWKATLEGNAVRVTDDPANAVALAFAELTGSRRVHTKITR